MTSGASLKAELEAGAATENHGIFSTPIAREFLGRILDAIGDPTNQGVKSFGAKGDAKKVTDGNTTGGSNTLTSASAAFVSTDVGKGIWAVIGDGTVLFAGRTIAAVNSSTSITISGAAIDSWLNLSVVWGTDDTTAIQTASADALARKTKIYLPAGGYIVSKLLFDFRFSVSLDAPNIEGAGSSLTTIFIDPNFDFSTVPAPHSALMASTNVFRQNISGFTIDGSKAAVSASGTSVFAFRGNGGFVQDVWVLHINGFRSGLQILATQTFISKCHVEDCNDLAIDVNGSAVTFFECYGGNSGTSLFVQGVNGLANTGFYVRWVGGIIDESLTAGAYIQTSTDISFIGAKLFGGVNAYAMVVDGTSTAKVTNSEIVPWGTVGNRGGLQVLAGGTCNLGQTRIAGAGTMPAIDNAGTLINAGGNTVTGSVTGTGLGAVA